MARHRPGLFGAILLVLVALFSQGAMPFAGAIGSPEIGTADEVPGALLGAALQNWDDPDEDLTESSGRGHGLSARFAPIHAETRHQSLVSRRARPRSTGPPAAPLPT